MQHARVAAAVAGLVVLVGAALPRFGGLRGEWTAGIETPYGDVAALLGIAVVGLALSGDVRGWRGGVVLTLGFGVLATAFPVLADALEGAAEAEVFVFLIGGAVAIACGAYGAGAARAEQDASTTRATAPETPPQ